MTALAAWIVTFLALIGAHCLISGAVDAVIERWEDRRD